MIQTEVVETTACPPLFLLETEDPGWVWEGMTYRDMEKLLIDHRLALEAEKVQDQILRDWYGKNCGVNDGS